MDPNTQVAIKRRRIHSSNIASLGYSPSTQTLEVRFLPQDPRSHERRGPSSPGGATYRYGGVPRNLVGELLRAESIGQTFAFKVRDKFPTRRIR